MLVLKKIDMAKNRKIVIPIIAGIIIFLILFFVVLAPTRKDMAGKNKKWLKYHNTVHTEKIYRSSSKTKQ